MQSRISTVQDHLFAFLCYKQFHGHFHRHPHHSPHSHAWLHGITVQVGCTYTPFRHCQNIIYVHYTARHSTSYGQNKPRVSAGTAKHTSEDTLTGEQPLSKSARADILYQLTKKHLSNTRPHGHTTKERAALKHTPAQTHYRGKNSSQTHYNTGQRWHWGAITRKNVTNHRGQS